MEVVNTSLAKLVVTSVRVEGRSVTVPAEPHALWMRYEEIEAALHLTDVRKGTERVIRPADPELRFTVAGEFIPDGQTFRGNGW